MIALGAPVGITSAPPGGIRAVLEASVVALQQGEPAALAVVVATEGSTYVRPGAMALFGADAGQVGWLSGGCLEPEIERRALQAAALGQLDWLDIDTRDDEDLLSGSAVGCRGRLHIALLPLQFLPGWNEPVAHWRRGVASLRLTITGDGEVEAAAGRQQRVWKLISSAIAPQARTMSWRLDIAPPPAVLVFGAGPETPALLPTLRNLGWITTLVERRPRWAPMVALADVAVVQAPEAALSQLQESTFDAALVMHHNFELDRETLAALAIADIGFIGLLGPTRRREDLFRLLAPTVREALSSRLRSPVGLDLGGHGPEAIALSIAAQLQTYRHSP
ncbi:MAG TPA: XdhC family protein [Lysobacter sp.]|jgi:xanthine dehydrogenase accessory factor|nr:XdhC family protein [Lysobacter sp.]